VLRKSISTLFFSCALWGVRGIFFLFWVAAICFPVQAADLVQFSNWEFQLPANLIISEQSADKLVLQLAPGDSGSASLTFYAPQSLQGDPSEWLENQWQALSAGHQIVYDAPQNEAALLDGSSGLRRSANTGNGESILQADAYVVQDKIQLMVIDGEIEQVMAAYLNLLPSLRLATTEPAPNYAASSDLPVTTAAIAKPDITPLPVGPDPYDSINWTAPDVVLRTTADLDEIEIKPAFDEFVSMNSGLLGGVQTKPVSFQNAMTTVQDLVNQVTSADHLAALRSYPNYQNREQLLNSAAGVLIQGKPAEALVRLQVAYERWPNDPEVLFNTAALLAQNRLVNESLAILDEMAKRGSLPDMSFGIEPQAAMDYLRGYNLMLSGSFSEADTLINKVVTNEPDFAEALLTAALLAHQLGKKPTTFFINGYFRRNGGQMKYPDKETAAESDSPSQESPAESGNTEPGVQEENFGDDDFVVLSAVHFMDVSRGKPGKLPSIYQPTTIEESLKFQKWFKAQTLASLAETQALDEARNRLDKRWRNKIPPGPQLEYYEEILRIFSEANARMPEIQSLLRARNRAIEDSTEAGGRFNDWFLEKWLIIVTPPKKSDAQKCSEVKVLVLETHDSLRVHVQAVDLATRRLHRLWHRYATALGTMVSDQDFRNYLAFDINFANQVEYGFLVGNMWESTQYAEYAKGCVSDDSKREWEKNLENSELAPCDDGATAGLGFTYGPVTVSSSCEGFTLGLEFDVGPVEVSSETEVSSTGEVTKQKTGGKINLGPVSVSGQSSRDKKGKEESTVGVEGGIPGLKGKAEVTMDNQGSTSVYAGGKAGDEFESAGIKVGASQESGVVVTVQDGSVSDVALKSTTSVTATAGGAGVNHSETRTVSFMPTPSVNRGSLPVYSGQ
jgi:tetratricopeptide (TPR) repeat protein